MQAFRNIKPRKIDFSFLLTLQTVLDDILCCHGGNNLKIAHIGKEQMLRNGELPTRLEASEEATAVARFVRNPRRQMNNDNNHGDNEPQEQGQMIQQLEAI